MKNFFGTPLLITSMLSITLIANAQTSGYHLIKKTIIGGEGGWDYLTADHENSRLYLSHSTQAEVLDLKTHKSIGTISPLNGIHGIAVINKKGIGITTNGRSNTATVVDLKTLKPKMEIPTGKNPDALLYDPFSDRIFIFNHSGASATVVDIATLKVAGTIDLGGEGVEAGATDGKGTIFVNLEDSHQIVSFDAKSLVVKNHWDITPGEEPTGLAYDQKNNLLFTVCHNELMLVIDASDGHIVAKVPIGKRVDGVVFDPATKLIISSNGEGTLTVIRQISSAEYKVTDTLQTAPGARTITLDPVTHHVFVSTAQYGETPAATADNPHPRPAIVPGTFMVMEFGAD